MSFQVQRQEEISTYQIPARFLGEIHIVLSCLIIACSIGTIVSFYSKIPEESPSAQMLDKGFILYVALTLIVSFVDVCLSVLLICAAKQASLEKCQIWQRFTISLLIAFTILTIAFGVLLSTALVILGLIPSLIYKPFAIWVVDGLIRDLKGHIGALFPTDSLKALAVAQGLDEDRKSTTVFIYNKDSPDIVESKSLLTKASRANTNANTIVRPPN